MKKKISVVFLILLMAGGSISLVYAWGAWGHKHISHAAVFALPDSMRPFYYNHIDFITVGAVVPDLRKYVINDKAEGPRHYVDIEDFGGITIPEIPVTTGDAWSKYDSTFLNKTGYLPWYIQNLSEKLSQAFKKKNKSEILFISAEISHYIGDAHMPLHTSNNYDGQKTNQKGIHALWESIIPPMFGNTYNFNATPATYIDDIPAHTWKIINQSHSLLDTLLANENKVRSRFTKETMYKKDKAGNTVMYYNSPVFSDEYARLFHRQLNGMVEQQMRLAIHETANFWYTAWVNGGSPDLAGLDDPHLFKQNKKNYRKELKAYKKGNLLNLSTEKE